MKKMLGILAVFLLVLCTREYLMAQEVCLGDEDILFTSSELEEISVLKDEMVRMLLAINGISTENGTDYDAKYQYYTENIEIHYDKAVKIYSNTYFFQLDTDDEEAILDDLDQGDHIWIVPVSLEGKKYSMTVTKGLPLSEDAKEVLTPEQQQEVIDREGKWFISEVAEEETDNSLWEMLLNRRGELEGCERVVLILDLPGFQYPVVLGFQDGKAARWVSLGYQYSIMEDAAEESGLMSEAAVAEQAGVFEYHELADRMEEYYDPSSDLNGGGGRRAESSAVRYWVIGGLAVALAGGVTVVLVKRKKR